jgi:hypothetical protein
VQGSIFFGICLAELREYWRAPAVYERCLALCYSLRLCALLIGDEGCHRLYVPEVLFCYRAGLCIFVCLREASMWTQSIKSLSAAMILGYLSGCMPLDNQYGYGSPGSSYGSPYSNSGGYYDPYYRDDPYYRNERRENRRERERLEDERERLQEERQRLERERQREVSRPAAPPPPPPERCPPGFSPSENKCRPEERKHGCKDIRLPGGLGCVRR